MALETALIEEYIENRKKRICNSNSCDYHSIHKEELDREEKRCREMYEAGKKLIDGIEKQDLQRCRRLYRLEEGAYGEFELADSRVLGTKVIVPVYVTLIERVISLKKVLA